VPLAIMPFNTSYVATSSVAYPHVCQKDVDCSTDVVNEVINQPLVPMPPSDAAILSNNLNDNDSAYIGVRSGSSSTISVEGGTIVMTYTFEDYNPNNDQITACTDMVTTTLCSDGASQNEATFDRNTDFVYPAEGMYTILGTNGPDVVQMINGQQVSVITNATPIYIFETVVDNDATPRSGDENFGFATTAGVQMIDPITETPLIDATGNTTYPNTATNYYATSTGYDLVLMLHHLMGLLMEVLQA
jgi:hypothetical protein